MIYALDNACVVMILVPIKGARVTVPDNVSTTFFLWCVSTDSPRSAQDSLREDNASYSEEDSSWQT